MSPLALASCAEAVKLWTFPDSQHIEHSPAKPTLSIKPHKHSITGVQFNHNGSALLTCGDDGLLALQKIDGALLCTLPAASASAAPPPLTCLAVTPGARYVCCGDVDGAVNVWDVKRQAVRWQLADHTDEVTCIDLNAASSTTAAQLLLASGSVSSHILTHSLESGQVASSLQLPSAAPVRCLQFSLHRTSLLAAGGDDGHPHLFDVTASTALSSFSAAHSHNTALSALLFSPVHPSLLLSASLSSTLAFHDTSSRQLVQRLTTSQHTAITAADWSEDGNYIAVGTGQGAIELYDVRREGERVAGWDAHDGEVRCVRWQRSRAGGAARVRDTPASVESRGRGNSTPLSVEAPSAAKRAALARDGVSTVAEEADGSYAPITPYVSHTKAFHSTLPSDKPPAPFSFVSSTVPSSSASASLAMSLPARVRAARAAAAASSSAATTSLAASSQNTDGDSLPLPFNARSLPTSPARDSISAAATNNTNRRSSPVSNRRSSYPAPAPFSSTLLNNSSISATSSVDNSRRNTLEYHAPNPLLPATNGSLTHSTHPASSPTQHPTALTHHPPTTSTHPTAAAPSPAPAPAPLVDPSSIAAAFDGLLVRRLGELSAGWHEQLVRLGVDMCRQFHVQSMEMGELVAGLREENRELREEMGRLREELTAHRAEADAASSWP